ncbi:amino acid ABC transporter permease [Cryobacterium sp. PH31-O1]|uniref:amino acid ABC transporter permease n=1 Tax=Cryobacterium sp. PH31-O1 TaxID=3046306 RepID=UPI0024BA0B16|nr:amino acid ABC transporter permease [Cryobacterium sp. PH31-O1]MDJ0339001.1 amino acid ABC transporter permease [Cryobacterium sp. PH31-O1]
MNSTRAQALLGADRTAATDGPRPRGATSIVQVIPARYPYRWIGGSIALLLCVWGLYTVATSPNITWSVVAAYILNGTILEGMRLTIVLTIVSLTVGVILGTVLATMRLSNNPVLQVISSAYITTFRGTPLLIQIIFWFNIALVVPVIRIGWPQAGFGFETQTNVIMTAMTAAILALGLNEAAYMAEIVRGGIISVPKGQDEAASSLGLTKRQAMWRVVLPQAVRAIVPPTGNQLIIVLKNTSLVSVIAARELLTATQQIYSTNFYTIELLIVAAGWYMVMTAVATILQGYLESRLEYSLRSRTHPFHKRFVRSLLSIGRKNYMEVRG